MQYSLPKTKASILYFAANTKYLGKIKLMKLLYYLDFEHVRRYGQPVLGDEYVHLEKGPIPSLTMNLISNLYDEPDDARLNDTVEIQTPSGTQMQKVIPVREFSERDQECFTPSEWLILQEIARRFKQTKTDDIISASHKEAPWLKTDYLQKIPYELATEDGTSKFTSDEVKFLSEL